MSNILGTLLIFWKGTCNACPLAVVDGNYICWGLSSAHGSYWLPLPCLDVTDGDSHHYRSNCCGSEPVVKIYHWDCKVFCHIRNCLPELSVVNASAPVFREFCLWMLAKSNFSCLSYILFYSIGALSYHKIAYKDVEWAVCNGMWSHEVVYQSTAGHVTALSSMHTGNSTSSKNQSFNTRKV